MKKGDIIDTKDLVPLIIYAPKNVVALDLTAALYEAETGEIHIAGWKMGTEDIFNGRVKGEEWEAENAKYVITDEALAMLNGED